MKKKETNKVTNSTVGTTAHMPVTPQNLGKIKIKIVHKITPRNKQIMSDRDGFIIPWK